MLGKHLDYKILLGLIIVAGLLGLGLAKLFYPTANPLEEKTTQTERLPIVFPENSPSPFPKSGSSIRPGKPQNNNKPKDGVCIQVVTTAVNKQTLELRQFPTPCDVPEGWEIL